MRHIGFYSLLALFFFSKSNAKDIPAGPLPNIITGEFNSEDAVFYPSKIIYHSHQETK